MKKILSLIAVMLCAMVQLHADKIEVSTVLPDAGNPEHVYTMNNGGGIYANGLTAPTQTAENYGLFAFYEVEGKPGAYYIYSHSAKKWLTYTVASSYANKTNFVKMSDTKNTKAYFKVTNFSGDNYEIRPYTSSGSNNPFCS